MDNQETKNTETNELEESGNAWKAVITVVIITALCICAVLYFIRPEKRTRRYSEKDTNLSFKANEISKAYLNSAGTVYEIKPKQCSEILRLIEEGFNQTGLTKGLSVEEFEAQGKSVDPIALVNNTFVITFSNPQRSQISPEEDEKKGIYSIIYCPKTQTGRFYLCTDSSSAADGTGIYEYYYCTNEKDPTIFDKLDNMIFKNK